MNNSKLITGGVLIPSSSGSIITLPSTYGINTIATSTTIKWPWFDIPTQQPLYIRKAANGWIMVSGGLEYIIPHSSTAEKFFRLVDLI